MYSYCHEVVTVPVRLGGGGEGEGGKGEGGEGEGGEGGGREGGCTTDGRSTDWELRGDGKMRVNKQRFCYTARSYNNIVYLWVLVFDLTIM